MGIEWKGYVMLLCHCPYEESLHVLNGDGFVIERRV